MSEKTSPERPRLSEAQVKMLARLRTGEKLSVSKGLYPSAWWYGDMGRANLNTVFALLDRGQAKRTDEDWRGFTVVPA